MSVSSFPSWWQGAVGAESARTPSASRTYWQNEDMDVDQRRKLVFLSRDPRAFGGSTNSNTTRPRAGASASARIASPRIERAA